MTAYISFNVSVSWTFYKIKGNYIWLKSTTCDSLMNLKKKVIVCKSPGIYDELNTSHWAVRPIGKQAAVFWAASHQHVLDYFPITALSAVFSYTSLFCMHCPCSSCSSTIIIPVM